MKRRKPFKHQEEALRHLQRLLPRVGGAALFMEYGTMKTKVVLDAVRAGLLPRPVLVVAFKECFAAWADECKIEGVEVDVLNYESSQLKERAASSCSLVLDESTAIKNPKAKRTKMLLRLAKAKPALPKVVLSGNPSPNSPLELYTQLAFCDPRTRLGANYWHFRRSCCKSDDPFGWKWTLTERGAGLLTRETARLAYQKTKEEALDLPPKSFETLDITPTRVQRKAFEQLRCDLEVRLGKRVIEYAYIMTVIVKARQVASGFLILEDKSVKVLVPPKRNPKLQALLRLLEYLPPRAAIWGVYKYELETVASHLPGRVIRHFGSKRDRIPTEGDFYFVGQVASSRGLNRLARAGITHAVYYSNSFSYEDRLQSEDRLHRPPLKSPVTYTDLFMKGGPDRKILETLRRKRSLHTAFRELAGKGPRALASYLFGRG